MTTDRLPLTRLVFNIAWISISALQYGFHISSLNAASNSIICHDPPVAGWGGPSCVPLTESQFGLVTSAYTIGGLVASVNTGTMIERWGQTKTATRAAWATFVGATIVTLAQSFWTLTLGRIIIGLACGIATVLVPLYLKTISPPAVAGSIGILCQVSINVGILLAQGVSIPLSTEGTGDWRKISFLSIFLAGFQIATSFLVTTPPESSSPIYDVLPSSTSDERAPLARLDSSDLPSSSSPSPDVRSSSSSAMDQSVAMRKVGTLSVEEVVRSSDPEVRTPLKALVVTMLFQQLSGINAVMFFSVTILTAVNPASAKATALFVTVVNLLMTFPSIVLIDRVGRSSLVSCSLATMSVSSVVLAWSINHEWFKLASSAIILFVMSFAVGLGPVPFVLVGELPIDEAKSATASVAVATNWISNLLIGVVFLPLRDVLARWSTSQGGGGGSGTVFYVFAVVSAVGAVVVRRLISRAMGTVG
ncbi:hypothetical protein JCM10212_000303 [Sporobolomyces blumeae]